MRIKHSAAISAYAAKAADELGMKPSRAGWAVRTQQAERFARLLEAEDRPSTHKVKRGVQAIAGRVRVERGRPCVEVDEVEMVADDRPRQWGVVCQTVSGVIYVTTAVVDEGVDVDTIATDSPRDRIVGVTNWIKDNRFSHLESMFVGNIDHPDCAEKIGEVIGFSADNYLVWYIPAK